MRYFRPVLLTSLAMIAFAGNSLLCRQALKYTTIDAASFTTLRIASGALVLWLIVHFSRRTASGDGNWASALALFAYAAGFSYAYLSLTAATGALLLFSAVQATMIGYAIWSGERLHSAQWLGLSLALGGLVVLLLPGLSAPPLLGTLLMLGAGIAWGIYSLRGKGKGDPTRVTTGNFIRAVPIAVAMSLIAITHMQPDAAGAFYAVASGALASGIGYAIWYTALPLLKSASAATVQLSVPVLATLGGIVLLGEAVTLHFVVTSAAIISGIALVILTNPKK